MRVIILPGFWQTNPGGQQFIVCFLLWECVQMTKSLIFFLTMQKTFIGKREIGIAKNPDTSPPIKMSAMFWLLEDAHEHPGKDVGLFSSSFFNSATIYASSFPSRSYLSCNFTAGDVSFALFPPVRGCMKDNRWRTASAGLSSLAPLPLPPPLPSVLLWDTHISEMLLRRDFVCLPKIAAFICPIAVSSHFLWRNRFILRCPIRLRES